MTDHITITGLIATEPRHIVNSEGLAITSFRFASPIRKFSRAEGKWVDVETNWYTITAFRALAINTAASLTKGDRLIVSGQVRIRHWATGERSGTVVEVEAESIGHDLAWGQSKFTRQRDHITVEADDPAPESEATESDDVSEAVAA